MIRITKWPLFVLLLFFALPSAEGRDPDRSPIVHRTHATWYAGKCVGRHLADRKHVYEKHAVFVATSLPYPFGTRLRITNLRNHRSIVAPIEDAEPYHPGRTLDLSYAAAEELGMIRIGVIPVAYSALSPIP